MTWAEDDSPLFPEGFALPGGLSAGWGEVVRPVDAPPGSSAVPPSSDRFGEEWRFGWACRRLDRLGRELRRNGWEVADRYGQVPPLVHVFAEKGPAVGDSVFVARGPAYWWFRSSTGAWLGPCMEPWRAAESVTALLAMWGISPRCSGAHS